MQRNSQYAARLLSQLDDNGKKKNKAKAYDSKIADYKAYCNAYFKNLPPDEIHQVTKTKVESFLTYCYYREQKPKGKCLTGTIDYQKANKIIEAYQNVKWESTGRPNQESLDLLKSLEPTNGCGYSVLNQTKCALKELWQEQWDLRKNSYGVQEVFGNYTKHLLKLAQRRKVTQDKRNFAEKIDKDSAPLAAVSHIDKLEEYLWTRGEEKKNARSLFSSLRNRFLFLFTVKGVLRGDCLYKAELSDLFQTTINCNIFKDPHEMMVSCQTIFIHSFLLLPWHIFFCYLIF